MFLVTKKFVIFLVSQKFDNFGENIFLETKNNHSLEIKNKNREKKLTVLKINYLTKYHVTDVASFIYCIS